MKSFAKVAGSLSTIVVLTLPSGHVASQTVRMNKPNIVIILADDQGYGGVNCYPHIKRIVTQNIDELANGKNARLKGMELMRKYQKNLKKAGKKAVPLSFGEQVSRKK